MRRKPGGGGEMESEWETVKEEAVTDSLYLCPVCNLLYSQAKCLLVHLKKAHQMDTQQADPYGISMEGSVLRLKRVWKNRQVFSYKCLKCDSLIAHRRKFGEHIRVDVELKAITCENSSSNAARLSSYQCDLFLTEGRKRSKMLCYTCGAMFGDRNSFLNHVETHGEVVKKKFVCEYCPYATHLQCYLKYHTEHKHPSAPRTRTHICELCGKGFYDKIVLTEHMKYTHLKKKKYLCDLCPKVFYRPTTLSKHKRYHSGKRPHVCLQCGQCFTAAYNLKVHQRLHTGEKPYQCKQCDAAFPQKNSLNVHMRKHKKTDSVEGSEENKGANF